MRRAQWAESNTKRKNRVPYSRWLVRGDGVGVEVESIFGDSDATFTLNIPSPEKNLILTTNPRNFFLKTKCIRKLDYPTIFLQIFLKKTWAPE